MKIIGSSKNIRHTCTFCHTILEIEIQDIIVNEVGHPAAEYIVCPVCRRVNDLAGKIPREWIQILYKDECGH